MTFLEVLEHAEKGKWIRRKEWSFDSFLILSITRRMLLDRSGDIRIFKIEDYKADDWEVYDNRKYFNLSKAMQLLKEGKKVSRKDWGDNGYLSVDDIKTTGSNNEKLITVLLAAVLLGTESLEVEDWYLVED